MRGGRNMEFQFETLEVYQKALNLYQLVSREDVGPAENSQPVLDLKRRILDVCQGIVTGASRWGKETKVRYFLNALDLVRCLTPLVEGACIDGYLKSSTRELLREEIDGLSKMLSSLARKTREWNARGEDEKSTGEGGSPKGPSRPSDEKEEDTDAAQ
jgi:hypothetical protein